METSTSKDFNRMMNEAMHLCGILQQKGNIDVERDILNSLCNIKTTPELERILKTLRELTNVNDGRSSDYR